jgi:hypothetical protein
VSEIYIAIFANILTVSEVAVPAVLPLSKAVVCVSNDAKLQAHQMLSGCTDSEDDIDSGDANSGAK